MGDGPRSSPPALVWSTPGRHGRHTSPAPRMRWTAGHPRPRQLGVPGPDREPQSGGPFPVDPTWGHSQPGPERRGRDRQRRGDDGATDGGSNPYADSDRKRRDPLARPQQLGPSRTASVAEPPGGPAAAGQHPGPVPGPSTWDGAAQRGLGAKLPLSNTGLRRPGAELLGLGERHCRVNRLEPWDRARFPCRSTPRAGS
jgi:hypothetical protein